MKACAHCGVKKRLDDFPADRKRKDGKYVYCRECSRAKSKAYYHADLERQREKRRDYDRRNPGLRRSISLKHKYGITAEEFGRMLTRQGGKCANPRCSNEPSDEARFHVDHDHACCAGLKTCGRCIRGLLCPTCNKALGFAGDDIDRLRGLADYLEGKS